MTTQKEREPSLADQVYERLLTDILNGSYTLQSRLPAEETLAQSLGVSRPVLRTALARLRDDGVIASRRGSGNYVTRRPDSSVMKFVPLGSISDIQRCYEFRADVESAAAAWAARRREDGDLTALEAAHERMDAMFMESELGVDADRALHQAIACATKNPFYMSVLSSLAEPIAFAMRLSRSLTLEATPERQALVQNEHRAIIDAIRDEDPELAAEAMRHHITAARERMFIGV